MQKIRSYQDLLVWQKSMTFAKEVIQLMSQNTSGQKLFKLTDQIQGAVASVPQNISEGWSRQSTKEYIQFLYIARGSLNETQTLLFLFKDLKWLKEDTVNKLINKADEISRMLLSLINKLKLNVKKNKNKGIRN